jgi:hypothetical protein
MSRGSKTGLLPCLVLPLSLLSACSAADDGGDPNPGGGASQQEFNDAIKDLTNDYGSDGKADLFGVSPCALLTPLFTDGKNLTHCGLFAGVEGDGVLGVTFVTGGYDLVWDLYHQQMSVSRYTGAGLTTPGVGASVEGYVGFATGFSHGVSDWDGYFVTTELEIGLPFLKDFVSLNPAVFVSGEDLDGNLVITPDEILVPPQGVYGFEMGVSLGFDLLPDPLPVAPSVSEGLWENYKEATRHFYDLFAGTRIGGVGNYLRVALVDAESHQPCAADWPAVDAERDCVVQFGDPDWSYTHRGAHVAYSICTALGGCAIPLSWSMSATAIAVGAYRDAGDRVSEMCPNL